MARPDSDVDVAVFSGRSLMKVINIDAALTFVLQKRRLQYIKFGVGSLILNFNL